MPSHRWIACAGVLLAASGAALAFDAQARAKVAVDALRLTPPALRRQLARHRDALQLGAMEDFSAVTQEAASRRLVEDVGSAVSKIDSHRSFAEISEALGRVAGGIAALNNPLWGEKDRASRSDSERFSAFIHERMDRFPLVFNGYGGSPLDGGDLAGFVGSVRARYKSDRDRLHLAYHP